MNKAQQSHASRRSGVNSRRLGSKSRDRGDGTDSQHTTRQNEKIKKNVPRFMSKKEKEAKENMDKRQKLFREKQKRMKELEKEIEEMQQLVFKQILDPQLKRRHTLTSFREMLPKQDQARNNMPS